jgi:transposase
MAHMTHIAAATQIRHDTDGKAYYLRKIAAGKTRREAMRCLKRRMSDVIYRQLVADARAAAGIVSAEIDEAGPGGHSGASHKSSAAGLHPHTGTSDQPLPGPAPTTLPAGATTRKSPASRTLQTAS